jgi:cytidyltransferase-related domain|tara:strand:- start:13281 stop:13811 length:531 start_codon:yes stop_codon:yes gene_type:complete
MISKPNKKTIKFIPFDRLEEVRKSCGMYYKIVATNGCFDILHSGHVYYLQEAKKMGHILIVGINSDKSVKQIKGEGRPINSQMDRAYVLSALECVDYVTIFPQKTATQFLKKVKPTIYVKGGDCPIAKLPKSEKKVLDESNSSIIVVNYLEGKSTTNTIKRVNNIGWGRAKMKQKK